MGLQHTLTHNSSYVIAAACYYSINLCLCQSHRNKVHLKSHRFLLDFVSFPPRIRIQSFNTALSLTKSTVDLNYYWVNLRVQMFSSDKQEVWQLSQTEPVSHLSELPDFVGFKKITMNMTLPMFFPSTSRNKEWGIHLQRTKSCLGTGCSRHNLVAFFKYD